jgi:hypothetical protein
MAAGDPEYVTVTAEHFTEPLGLPDLADAVPERRRELFAALMEDLDERGLVADVAWRDADNIQEVNLLIPGTPVHVHATAVNDATMVELAGLAGGLGLLHHHGGYVITLAGLRTLKRLFTRVRTEYGERSILEVLSATARPTAEAVAGELHGAPCRHANAGCRFMTDNEHCSISAAAVDTTLSSLAERQVVVRRNAVAPYEYNITF